MESEYIFKVNLVAVDFARLPFPVFKAIVAAKGTVVDQAYVSTKQKHNMFHTCTNETRSLFS
jgi:hypothetical protein